MIFATALFIASCGQKENNEQEQPKDKEVYIPQGVPVAPMQEIQIQEKGEALGDPWIRGFIMSAIPKKRDDAQCSVRLICICI